MTQEELAAKASITREYVSHLERNEYSPTLEILFRLCNALQIKPWVFVRRVERSRR